MKSKKREKEKEEPTTRLIRLENHNYYMYMYILVLPYNWKYWRELNLAAEPRIAITRIWADLNLADRHNIIYIYIYIYASMKFWWILIWWF